LSALAASSGGCQLIAGLGGEETLATGGTGGTGATGGSTGTSTGGTGGTGLTGPCTPGESEDCYSGPAGTQGVALCKAGTALCGQDAMWGECSGEVLPQPESCASPDDENCDGLDCTTWVKTLTGDVYGTAVAADAQGNVYASVAFYSGVDFGDGTPVVPLGNGDVALVKYDAAGKLLWKKVFPAAGTQEIRDIAVDPSGNVAFIGQSDASIDFGKGPIPAGVFVVKLDPEGTALWSAVGQASSYAAGTTIASDSKGHVVIGGVGKSIDFGTGAIDAVDGNSFFVGKLDGTTGQALWVKISKGGANETLGGIAVDPSDSVVLAGTWNGAYIGLAGAEAAPNDLYNCCGLEAPFLLRLAPDGSGSDGKMLAGYQDMLALAVNGLGVDKFGVSTLVGDFAGKLDFQSGLYDSGLSSGMFVVHDQTTGFNQWSKGLVQAGVSVGGQGVAIDGHDNMVIHGQYGGPLDLGGGALPETGASQFVVKLDKEGNFLWNRAYSVGDGGVAGIAAGTFEDETLLIGTFYGSVDFGAGLVEAQQGVFLARLGK